MGCDAGEAGKRLRRAFHSPVNQVTAELSLPSFEGIVMRNSIKKLLLIFRENGFEFFANNHAHHQLYINHSTGRMITLETWRDDRGEHVSMIGADHIRLELI